MQAQIARTLAGAAAPRAAARSFATTPAARFAPSAAARLATPTTGPDHAGRAPAHTMPIEKARHQTAVETPDYSNGPSALDKAASLFFFSEIARGAYEFSGRTAGRELTGALSHRYGRRVGAGAHGSEVAPSRLLRLLTCGIARRSRSGNAVLPVGHSNGGLAGSRS